MKYVIQMSCTEKLREEQINIFEDVLSELKDSSDFLKRLNHETSDLELPKNYKKQNFDLIIDAVAAELVKMKSDTKYCANPKIFAEIIRHCNKEMKKLNDIYEHLHLIVPDRIENITPSYQESFCEFPSGPVMSRHNSGNIDSN